MRAFEFLAELNVRYGAKRHTIGDVYGKRISKFLQQNTKIKEQKNKKVSLQSQ